jgi:hypothetical protein
MLYFAQTLSPWSAARAGAAIHKQSTTTKNLMTHLMFFSFLSFLYVKDNELAPPHIAAAKELLYSSIPIKGIPLLTFGNDPDEPMT